MILIGIVISDLKDVVIFIFGHFKQKKSNLVKNDRHIEAAVFNFSVLSVRSYSATSITCRSLIIVMFHANNKCAPERINSPKITYSHHNKKIVQCYKIVQSSRIKKLYFLLHKLCGK